MYNTILEYVSQDMYPFHMPGHKRNLNFFPPEMVALDITEIPEMDILSAPTGIIAEFQKKIANFYQARESFFLVNGSSAGIVAAICATCGENSPVLVPRNAHVSLYNGLVFSGAKPIYYLPEITPDGLAGGVAANTFNDIPHGAVVFVVSPTYEGFVSDISAIAKKVHERGGVLIVDEAHGAHFAFHKSFPKTALSQGADIVINSLHKTLPAISGCAVLHVRDSSRIDVQRLRFYVNAMQTSSPSYMLMASCDFMLEKLWQAPALFDEYVTRLEETRQALTTTEGTAIKLSSRERIGQNAIFDIDEGKLLFALNETNTTAEEISAIMASEYKLQPEMAKGRHLLLMTSVADTAEGFSRLKTAITGLNQKFVCPCAKPPYVPASIPTLPEAILTPREALKKSGTAAFRQLHELQSQNHEQFPSLQKNSEEIPVAEAIGRISTELIAEYPPGIAIIAQGELIQSDVKIPKPTIIVLLPI